MKTLIAALLIIAGGSISYADSCRGSRVYRSDYYYSPGYSRVYAGAGIGGSWRSVEYLDDNPVYYRTNRRAYLVDYGYDREYRHRRGGRAWASYYWDGDRGYRGANCQAMRMASRHYVCD